MLLALCAAAPAWAFPPQRGEAAVYHTRFEGRPMANGAPFRADHHVAAHRHLPLGTQAVVTNLRTGASTVVTISDRGPFTPGRILDLSPRSAREIGLRDLGEVEIRPVGAGAGTGLLRPAMAATLPARAARPTASRPAARTAPRASPTRAAPPRAARAER